MSDFSSEVPDIPDHVIKAKLQMLADDIQAQKALAMVKARVAEAKNNIFSASRNEEWDSLETLEKSVMAGKKKDGDAA